MIMFFPNFSLQKFPTFINVGTNLSRLFVLIGCNLHGIKPSLKLGWAPNHSQNCIRGSTKPRKQIKNKILKPKVLFKVKNQATLIFTNVVQFLFFKEPLNLVLIL